MIAANRLFVWDEIESRSLKAVENLQVSTGYGYYLVCPKEAEKSGKYRLSGIGWSLLWFLRKIKLIVKICSGNMQKSHQRE